MNFGGEAAQLLPLVSDGGTPMAADQPLLPVPHFDAVDFVCAVIRLACRMALGVSSVTTSFPWVD